MYFVKMIPMKQPILNIQLTISKLCFQDVVVHNKTKRKKKKNEH